MTGVCCRAMPTPPPGQGEEELGTMISPRTPFPVLSSIDFAHKRSPHRSGARRGTGCPAAQGRRHQTWEGGGFTDPSPRVSRTTCLAAADPGRWQERSLPLWSTAACSVNLRRSGLRPQGPFPSLSSSSPDLCPTPSSFDPRTLTMARIPI